MTDEETTLEGGAKKKDEYLSVIWNSFKTKQYIITMCILQIGASTTVWRMLQHLRRMRALDNWKNVEAYIIEGSK